MIDVDTPMEARTLKAFQSGADMELVFSDEFNREGRSFYPGDDPYWEAVDLNYWPTGDLGEFQSMTHNRTRQLTSLLLRMV